MSETMPQMAGLEPGELNTSSPLACQTILVSACPVKCSQISPSLRSERGLLLVKCASFHSHVIVIVTRMMPALNMSSPSTAHLEDLLIQGRTITFVFTPKASLQRNSD